MSRATRTVSPSGKLKWTFSDPGSAIIFAGPTVGPDGNIYAVSSDTNVPGGLYAFQLGGTTFSGIKAPKASPASCPAVTSSTFWVFRGGVLRN
jgi:outer membrane protein assembly factor BamB